MQRTSTASFDKTFNRAMWVAGCGWAVYVVATFGLAVWLVTALVRYLGTH